MDFNRRVAERAYELWVKRGRPHGSHEEDWLEAERQLAPEPQGLKSRSESEHRDASLEATFPASDPPASHLPDTPPANASEKWVAVRNKTRAAPAEAALRAEAEKSKPSRGGKR